MAEALGQVSKLKKPNRRTLERLNLITTALIF